MVALKWNALIGLLMIGLAVPANADELADYLLRQLSCRVVPNITPALEVMREAGRLTGKSGVDSETCWALSPPIAVDGTTFSFLCASADDPFVINTYPEFYWRGPGTSAGDGFRVLAAVSHDEMKRWADRNLEEGVYHIDDAYPVGETDVAGMTEVRCNSFDIPAR